MAQQGAELVMHICKALRQCGIDQRQIILRTGIHRSRARAFEFLNAARHVIEVMGKIAMAGVMLAPQRKIRSGLQMLFAGEMQIDVVVQAGDDALQLDKIIHVRPRFAEIAGDGNQKLMVVIDDPVVDCHRWTP
ncbi:hypothetical protein GCM10008941_07890 [Rhizomicrobium palustre]